MEDRQAIFEEKVQPLRANIDIIDRTMVTTLGAMSLLSNIDSLTQHGLIFQSLISVRSIETEEVGKLKRKYDVDPTQSGRYEEVLKNVTSYAAEHLPHLNVEVVDSIWRRIHSQSVSQQREIIEQAG